MATTSDISVRVIFYDDEQRSPVVLKVKRNVTINELYSMVTSEVDINNFQLCHKTNNGPIERCNTPLSVIFQGNEVDVLLVLTMDGAGGSDLISPCADCPGCHGDDQSVLCGPCNGLVDDLIIDGIVTEREDAWIILSNVFNISTTVQQKIEENHADNGVRCIDVMHHIYHLDTTLNWDRVKAKLSSHDSHLAKVIIDVTSDVN